MCPLCQDSRHTLSQCKRWMMKAALARNAATASQDIAPYPPELLAIVQGMAGSSLGQNLQPHGSDVRDS
jgi:hypothetical protein